MRSFLNSHAIGKEHMVDHLSKYAIDLSGDVVDHIARYTHKDDWVDSQSQFVWVLRNDPNEIEVRLLVSDRDIDVPIMSVLLTELHIRVDLYGPHLDWICYHTTMEMSDISRLDQVCDNIFNSISQYRVFRGCYENNGHRPIISAEIRSFARAIKHISQNGVPKTITSPSTRITDVISTTPIPPLIAQMSRNGVPICETLAHRIQWSYETYYTLQNVILCYYTVRVKNAFGYTRIFSIATVTDMNTTKFNVNIDVSLDDSCTIASYDINKLVISGDDRKILVSYVPQISRECVLEIIDQIQVVFGTPGAIRMFYGLFNDTGSSESQCGNPALDHIREALGQ